MLPQAFKNDLSRHSQEYESVRSLGETFLAGCDVDKEGVKKDLDALRSRWDKLNQGKRAVHSLLPEVIAQDWGGFAATFGMVAGDPMNEIRKGEGKILGKDLGREMMALQALEMLSWARLERLPSNKELMILF